MAHSSQWMSDHFHPRPSVVDDDKLAIARARHAKGESVTAIAKALGISRATLYRHIGESA
ncbi:helix-turn-helix domain-containing protein [Streptomyces sp. NPDC090029]|uniref:helix-turn-helix domain-containing protein n=1 Tax=Streptomyces sp. NPDC090029 TaxID=3365924 RepID=UPI00381C1A37